MRVIERSVEVERADERDLGERDAYRYAEILSRLPGFSASKATWVPHHEEDGHVYPARLHLDGINPVGDSPRDLFAFVESALRDQLPRITVMGTGESCLIYPKLRVVE